MWGRTVVIFVIGAGLIIATVIVKQRLAVRQGISVTTTGTSGLATLTTGEEEPSPANGWNGQPPPVHRTGTHEYWEQWCNRMWYQPTGGPHYRQNAMDWSDHCTKAGDAYQYDGESSPAPAVDPAPASDLNRTYWWTWCSAVANDGGRPKSPKWARDNWDAHCTETGGVKK